jgi:hypothetical protein
LEKYFDGEIREMVKHAISSSLKQKNIGIGGSGYDVVRSDREHFSQNIDENIIVLVCGTAFIMADARAEIGIIEDKDGNLYGDDDSDNKVSKYSDLQVFSSVSAYFVLLTCVFRNISPIKKKTITLKNR